MRNRYFNYIVQTLFIILIFITLIPIIYPLLSHDFISRFKFIPDLSIYFKKEDALLNVSIWLLTVFFGGYSVKFRRNVLKPEIYCRDKYFVDRIDERDTLFLFLEIENKEEGSVFFLKGGMCRGKSALIKRFADDVNGKDIPGSLIRDHPKAKKYSAYYVSMDECDSVFLCISQVLHNDDTLNTCGKIVDFFRKASYRPKALLIIDNICKEQSRTVTEEVHKLLYRNKFLKVIMVITEDVKTIGENILVPPLFGEMHVQELSQVYNEPLSSEVQEQIIRISGGIPSYIRMIFQTNVMKRPAQLSNIENIHQIIKGQYKLLDSHNKIVDYLSYLNLCYEEAILKEDILILAKASETQLDSVLDVALAHKYEQHQKCYIRMETLVAQCCQKFIYPDEVLKNIYFFYIHKDEKSDIALTSILLHSVQSDIDIPPNILEEKYAQKKFLFFARLGILDQEHKLLYCYKDVEFYNKYRYYYLNSLLQLGQYSLASEELNRYENSDIPLPSLRKSKDVFDFEMQYLIIDLHHLSNRFGFALGEIDVILSKGKELEECHIDRLLYLKAHCLKHLGSDLPEADDILKKLSEKNLSQAMHVKVLYSRIAIHLFWGDKSFPYEAIIHELEDVSEEGSQERVHMMRHIACYYWKIKKDSHRALNIINSSLDILEKNRWRIIYDFYFEKAELMRIQNMEQIACHTVSAILSLYDKAIDFAEENKDINLACCARLGKILASWPDKQSSSLWRKEQLSIAETEYKKVREVNLLINSAYATYVKSLLSNEEPSEYFLIYCKRYRYDDLVRQIENKGILKLTVM